jgi:nitroreductase
MDFGAPITDIIKTRVSWRSFSGQPLTKEYRDKLEAALAELTDPPFGAQARFALVDAGVEGAKRVPGTYGVIRGTRDFFVATVKAGERNLEDYGYLFEKAILYATSLNLGTCWMGGTLKHTVFADKIDLTGEEKLPCISPVGVRAGSKTMLDKVFAAGARSRKRKNWDELFFADSFAHPIEAEQAGIYADALEMVRLAPSASNRQPWRLVKTDSGVHFFLQRNVGYRKLFKADLQRVDLGIAMCHFDFTARESGLDGHWVMTPPSLPNIPERTTYVATWFPATPPRRPGHP